MIRIQLTAEERSSLERIRNRHPVSYLRERASAILKVADGWSIRRVALMGLPKKRRPETVGVWVHHYSVARSVLIQMPRRRRFSP